MLFSGNANPELATAITAYLELPLGQCRIHRFSDGEVFAEVQENVRGVDVYVSDLQEEPKRLLANLGIAPGVIPAHRIFKTAEEAIPSAAKEQRAIN